MNYVNLNELGLIRISGTASADFLQGQLSCDVREVSSNQSRLTAHCNFKGRVLATGRLFMIDTDYYLVISAGLVPHLLKDLRKYAAFYSVALEDESFALARIGLVGPDLASYLHNVFDIASLEVNAVYSLKESTLLIVPGVVPRAIIIAHNKHPATQTLQPFFCWAMIDIKSGLAHVTAETRGLFTPHQLNYHHQGGISFTKGCYTGQEVIARMHYLGKLKQNLYQLTVQNDSQPALGTSLLDARENHQGTVATVALNKNSLSEEYRALALIQEVAVNEALYLQGNRVNNLQKALVS